ncbi:DUF1330 domain-containing protein [Bradyrhizobium iriomotense]|uniref:DUF1330 domain-containing protein n=1 Tax=Bradyrhizobium iriomotense TaxID=441950 RepID=A0ABQ6BFR7_9BRAD|nr:DUF1330 domain-containing protein [Bradyrhizobium iriomotense]GLR91780.1 hypothetical protein GCM10007857_84980 [Bradyrhizobium iriomotense]
MKSKAWGIASVAVCIALGVAPAATAQAQEAAPHAFLVAIESIHDMETFSKEYGPKVPATLQPYGGRFLVRGGMLTNLEGEAPGRFVIIEFDSLQNALNWYQSPEYQKLIPLRQKASRSTLFIAEGPSK